MNRLKLPSRICRGFCRDTWWNRLLVASVYLLSTLLYLKTNRLAANAGRAIVFKWAADDRIPFVPFFVFPYFAWFLLVAGVFLWLVFDRSQGRRIDRHTTAIVLAMAVSALIFLVFPTHVPRPELTGGDLPTRLVRVIYAADEPYNCFPSLHVAIALINGLALFRYGPHRIWFRLSVTLLVILIILSTILIRQHYLPDLAGGLALALICDRISRLVFPDRLIRPSAA